MKRKGIILSICLLCLLVIGTSICFINKDTKDVYTNQNIDLIDKPVMVKDDNNEEIINGYINKYNNQDVVGEISILNTDYKKALMQYSNNDYYLNHTEDKTSSYMGAIYLDFRIDVDTSKKLLIYGHNSATISMPFEILEEYYDYNYYNDHMYIEIVTKNKTRLYKIYSVFVEVSDFSYMQTDFDNEDDWYNHISAFKDKSMYDTGVEVFKEDNIVILQTCSTHRDYNNYDKKYLLVVAKEVIGN